MRERKDTTEMFVEKRICEFCNDEYIENEIDKERKKNINLKPGPQWSKTVDRIYSEAHKKFKKPCLVILVNGGEYDVCICKEHLEIALGMFEY